MGKFKDIIHTAIEEGYDTEETMECLTIIVDEHLEHMKKVAPAEYNRFIARIENMFDGDHMTHDMLHTANMHFRNTDGSSGFKWSIDATTQTAERMGVVFDKYSKEDFCYAMNMMYSDFYRVLTKYGLNKPSVYVEMADAFLDDPDAPSDKAVRYYKAMSE